MKIILEKSKYFMLVAVVGLLVTHVFALFWASVKSYDTWVEIISSVGQSEKITVYLIKVIDGFLIAFVLYLLSVSIYRMVFGEIAVDDSLVANSLPALKSKLSSVMVLVIAIRFIESLFDQNVDPQRLLYLAIATAITGGTLIAFTAFGAKDGDH